MPHLANAVVSGLVLLLFVAVALLLNMSEVRMLWVSVRSCTELEVNTHGAAAVRGGGAVAQRVGGANAVG